MRRPENTHREVDRSTWETGRFLSFAWETSGSSPSFERSAGLCSLLERPSDFCLQSKITELILSFQVPCGNMKILFASRIFCSWLVIGTYILPVFFPVICWSYLRMEISVILSISNKLYSRHYPLFFSETTLLMLSCDCTESAKFTPSTPSPAKLVYYMFTIPLNI